MKGGRHDVYEDEAGCDFRSNELDDFVLDGRRDYR
jgi:hypothetical protein